jgi:hypothetical protein
VIRRHDVPNAHRAGLLGLREWLEALGVRQVATGAAGV